MQFAESVIVRGADGGTADVSKGAMRINPRTRFLQAVQDGRAFSWASLTYDAVAADTVFGLENNDTTYSLYLHQIIIGIGNAATECKVFGANGITVAGATAVAGVNLNRNYGTVPNTTAFTKETGQNEAGSSWLTTFYNLRIPAQGSTVINVNGAIVLKTDAMIGVDYVAGNPDAANVTVVGWFE